jgi:hypothetical protein
VGEPPLGEQDEGSPPGDQQSDVAKATDDLVGGLLLAAESTGAQLSPTETEALFRVFSDSDAGMVARIADRCRYGLQRLLGADGSDEGWLQVDGVALPTSWAESYQRLSDLDDPPIAFAVLEDLLDTSQVAPRSSSAPPGWHPDPAHPGYLLWWDGIRWTDQRMPAPAPRYWQAPLPQTTNGYAIAALVLGIIWIYGIGAILALVFGYKARREIDESGGRQGGRGMAVAGIVLGWVGIAGLVIIVVAIALVALLGSNDSSTSGMLALG